MRNDLGISKYSKTYIIRKIDSEIRRKTRGIKTLIRRKTFFAHLCGNNVKFKQ